MKHKFTNGRCRFCGIVPDAGAPCAPVVVVTRHPALVELLRERGLVTDNARVIAHAEPDDVEACHVVGVLPLSLAVLAASVTEIPLALTPADRGVELGIDRLRAIAGPAITYVISEI